MSFWDLVGNRHIFDMKVGFLDHLSLTGFLTAAEEQYGFIG